MLSSVVCVCGDAQLSRLVLRLGLSGGTGSLSHCVQFVVHFM